MNRLLITVSGLALGLASSAHAANIYILSSGDSATDNAAIATLTAHGHTVTLGVTFELFDGSVNLQPYDTVYLQCNYNWTTGLPMPTAGQQQLMDWVSNDGGRLVTSEWVVYYTYPGFYFQHLGAILPVEPSITYTVEPSTTYLAVTPDPAINAGVPSSLTFPLTSYSGTETLTVPKSGAVTYYTTATGGASPPHTYIGLAGWTVAAGKVYSFSSTCGPDQLANPDFARLFSNVMGPIGGTCYANCDGSTQPPILNVADFGCFLGKFAAGDPYANCDSSTQPPILNVADFGCFLGKFAAGCR